MAPKKEGGCVFSHREIPIAPSGKTSRVGEREALQVVAHVEVRISAWARCIDTVRPASRPVRMPAGAPCALRTLFPTERERGRERYKQSFSFHPAAGVCAGKSAFYRPYRSDPKKELICFPYRLTGISGVPRFLLLSWFCPKKMSASVHSRHKAWSASMSGCVRTFIK